MPEAEYTDPVENKGEIGIKILYRHWSRELSFDYWLLSN